MATIVEALDLVAAKRWYKEWQNPVWKQFIATGDKSLLPKIPAFKDYSWLPPELLNALPSAGQLDEGSKRFLRACHSAGHKEAVGTWIAKCNDRGAASEAEFSRACEVAIEIGCSKDFIGSQIIQRVRPIVSDDGRLNPAAKFLLALNDNEVEELYREFGKNDHYGRALVEVFVKNAPDRWKRLLETLNKKGDSKVLHPCTWILALSAAPAEFLEVSARAFELVQDGYLRFQLGEKLCAVDPARFGLVMENFAKDQLLAHTTTPQKIWRESQQAALWLVANRGKQSLAILEKYFAAALTKEKWHHKNQAEQKKEVLDAAVQKLGRDALALLEACFATEQPEVQLRALHHWSGHRVPGDTESVANKLRQLFASEDAASVARAIRLAGELVPEAVEKELWSLFSHKSKPVREAASTTLAKLGESRLPKAADVWAARKADTRIAGAAWLKALGTAKAAEALKARLEDEEDDNVRDAILLALEKLPGGATNSDPTAMQQRIKKTLAKIDGSPVKWLDPKSLPAPKLVDGSKLSSDWLLYLLYRQSRVKEMRADIEAKSLYAQIDRKTTGELALSVAQAFFGSKAEADDRWTMAFAAILGDDRLVPALTRQIKEWADSMRGKLAEYAAQALALLGSDAALLALDAMAIRYRSKNKNIGKAASEAFAEAAHARGLTVEELGDLVVPWLGFQPGQARIVEAGKSKIEARINNDFKLTFRDVATNKKVAKLPDSASAEVKADFKELSASLKEAVKSQFLRMETLMVRQFRWPRARWEELYLQHPLLLPFAQRLVWGAYDKSGKLLGTFRALEDRSLTDAEDEPYSLPSESDVGIVHPLELTAENRQTWLKHLADYDIVPPFAQLERTVVTVNDEQAKTKFGNEVANTELNAMTFKGRAEKLGWGRGSVCDGGGINHYVKTFPGAGVDVFVGTEGMYVGIDMYSNITLERIFFVKHGSVQIGSYTYDEPGDTKDPRLLSYAEVPPIAFSEAMGDLIKISGKSATQETEAADA
jgi:Domain of unknown function (DUF4132)